MTPEIIPLLAATLASFSVLAFFARRNKRTGWVKPRVTLEDLIRIEADWKQYAAPIRMSLPNARSQPNIPGIAATEFTQQLANFTSALGTASSVKPHPLPDPIGLAEAPLESVKQSF
jgi:hypothetical protein